MLGSHRPGCFRARRPQIIVRNLSVWPTHCSVTAGPEVSLALTLGHAEPTTGSSLGCRPAPQTHTCSLLCPRVQGGQALHGIHTGQALGPPWVPRGLSTHHRPGPGAPGQPVSHCLSTSALRAPGWTVLCWGRGCPAHALSSIPVSTP